MAETHTSTALDGQLRGGAPDDERYATDPAPAGVEPGEPKLTADAILAEPELAEPAPLDDSPLPGGSALADGSVLAEDATTGELELADRHALRRVAGLSTELTDVTEVEYRRLRLERVVLVGVWTEGTLASAEQSLAELAALAETAGSQVLEGLIQRRGRPDPATYVGRGKVDELRDVVVESGADTVVCDGELSPSQLRNLETRVKVKVIDRTALILDIFAQHAKSREGKAQVELAQLEYLIPRLRGWGESLSRQAGGRAGGASGGVGTRGPGETKLETDRRRIRQRVAKLRREIKAMRAARDTKRADRRRHDVPGVAIAGYTNAGKSSLLNRITGAGVLVEDALFATLDPTTRRARTGDGRIYTLSDTVGFVRHLPHQLVEAFRSTLEEVADADLVLHVVDGSDPDPEAQVAAVREVLAEIDAASRPELLAVNKIDAADPETLLRLRRIWPDAVFCSAHSGAGIDELRAALEARLPRPPVPMLVRVPYDRGDLVNRAREHGEVLELEHTAEGTVLRVRVDPVLANELAPFALAAPEPEPAPTG
ncbi:GTPase HflX [Actinocatenispora sera]|uniref:GTPase HflX n=1 Tax=Actinocatenispora sera TaxID=390989 RepID=A0A810L1Z1_9ACTN|nr:GTPase HflX [Actinocatenispora sera]BCJ29237.1 GTPase HflX [Actinocatenispora sera]